jgi:hypothetical protein
MKQWINLALVCAWALSVNAVPMEQQPSASAQDICDLLTSRSAEGQMVRIILQFID